MATRSKGATALAQAASRTRLRKAKRYSKAGTTTAKTTGAPEQEYTASKGPVPTGASGVTSAPESSRPDVNSGRIAEINTRISELYEGKKPGMTGDPLTSIFRGSTTESQERDRLLQELESLGGSRPEGSEDYRPLGDRVPQPPDVYEDPTGIAGPGETDPQTIAELGQGVVTSIEEGERDRQAAQLEDQARGNILAGEVREDIGETTGRIDTAADQVAADQVRFQASMEGAADQIEKIPEEVTKEFDRLNERFGDAADVSFDRIGGQRAEALGNVDQGRSEAMQAAVQGIQGNVNTQTAQIMANPNLTASQKQSMVAQVKLAGASSIAPAIGQTVLAFNQLSADVATKFGAITGQLESTVLTGEAELAGLQGQAFTEAQVQVGKMTNQLLEIDANASASFANSQSQLLATRTHATMTGNQILLNTLPEQSTPWLDITGSAIAAYEIGRDVVTTQREWEMGSFGMEMTIASLRAEQGNPVANIVESIIGGYVKGGPAGAAFGLVEGGASEMGREYI